MPPDSSLRARFWRDVATAAGPRELDPRAIRDAVEDMMRNYHLDEIPGFEADTSNVPDTSNFSNHSTFTPVFSRTISNALCSLGCFNPARPIFVGPDCMRRRRSCSESQRPNHVPGSGNPGIEASTDQPSAPDPPTLPGSGAPPSNSLPQLSPWQSQNCVWGYPTGHFWSPHPQSNPCVTDPMSPWAAMARTGGHPLPGTMPQWTPGTWPPLHWSCDVPVRLSPHIIPNPNNTYLPMIDWNVTKHPSTAKRLTPNHVVVDMNSLWGDAVTHTNAQTIAVACDVGYMSTLWGPIVIDQSKPVTVRDLFEAIYAYFQVQLTCPEVQYILDLHPSNYRRLTDAYLERCRESAALPGWEAMQGFRRVDVLGDRKFWWGVWISSRQGTWWLNLGLINPSHRGRSR